MLLGTIAAIAHGASFPLLWLFLGSFVDVFAAQQVTQVIVSNVTSTFPNVTIDCNTMLPGNVTVTNIIQQTISDRVSCLLGDGFIAEVNNITYAFIGIGLAALLVAYFQISFFQTAAERQVYKIRLEYYRAVLRQNIAWFDENPTGELATRLSE